MTGIQSGYTPEKQMERLILNYLEATGEPINWKQVKYKLSFIKRLPNM